MVKKLCLRKKILAGVIICLLFSGFSFYLMAGKNPGKGYLGVSVERISSEKKEELGVTFGVLVNRVIKGEAADKAGIQEGDVIQYFNDEKIRRPSDLVEEVRSVKPESKATIVMVRKRKKLKIKVIMGKYILKHKKFWKPDKDFFICSPKGAYLGVYLQKLNKNLAKYFQVTENGGALILKVEADTPAEEAGLKSGDVIVGMNEKKIKNPEDVTEFLSDFEKGDKVDITIIRHGKRRSLEAELDERPGFRQMKIFKGWKGDEIDIRVPSVHIEIPDFDECKVKWDDQVIKLKKELKKVKQKIHKKLKIAEEFISI